MGEEYGETAPFPYFVSHSEPALIEAVRRGRSEEFASFKRQGELHDPQDERTFLAAKINHDLREEGQHQTLLGLYKELIQVRKHTPALACLNKERMKALAYEKERIIVVQRWDEENEAAVVFNFSDRQTSVVLPLPAGRWQRRLDSAEERWQGNGSVVPERLSSSGEVSVTFSPWAVTLFVKEA